MNTVRREMSLVQEVDQPGSAIDKYVAGLSAILASKARERARAPLSRSTYQPPRPALALLCTATSAHGCDCRAVAAALTSMYRCAGGGGGGAAGAAGGVPAPLKGGGDPQQNCRFWPRALSHPLKTLRHSAFAAAAAAAEPEPAAASAAATAGETLSTALPAWELGKRDKISLWQGPVDALHV